LRIEPEKEPNRFAKPRRTRTTGYDLLRSRRKSVPKSTFSAAC
jgi:hypothetical protein